MHCTEDYYQRVMQEVTAIFSQLSRDLISMIGWFRDNGQSECGVIVENIQLKEKEKLQLVVN